MKVRVFTPSHSGRVVSGLAMAMVEAGALMQMAGVDYEWQIRIGGCFMHVIRERAARAFLDSDATHLVMVDDDVAFEADAVLRLLHAGRDVIGAVVPKRGGGYACSVESVGSDVFECHYIGTGLICLSRRAVVRMAEEYPLIFDAHWVGQKFEGEDVDFCRRWRALGGKVYADGAIRTSHTGTYTWGETC